MNISKGRKRETLWSAVIHKDNTPLLISPIFLRSLGAGQIDLATISKHTIDVFEVKGRPYLSRKQKMRISQSCEVLRACFKKNVRFSFLHDAMIAKYKFSD